MPLLSTGCSSIDVFRHVIVFSFFPTKNSDSEIPHQFGVATVFMNDTKMVYRVAKFSDICMGKKCLD